MNICIYIYINLHIDVNIYSSLSHSLPCLLFSRFLLSLPPAFPHSPPPHPPSLSHSFSSTLAQGRRYP